MSNTLVDSAAVASAVAYDYPIAEPSSCTLIGRGFNDHYLLETPTARYVCRVYLNGKYYISGPDDFRFELELLTFLDGRGLGVAAPLRRRDDQLLGSLPGCGRSFAVFAYAPGAPAEQIDRIRAEALGVELAQIHRASDDFESTYQRYHLDTDLLLDQPIMLITKERTAGNKELRDLFQAIDTMPSVEQLRDTLAALPRTRGVYGIIHADPHLANVHFHDDRPMFFDFDHCAYGWRAYDLATLLLHLPPEVRQHGLRGYESVRPLSPPEQTALPVFEHLRKIWDTGDILAMRPTWNTR